MPNALDPSDVRSYLERFVDDVTARLTAIRDEIYAQDVGQSPEITEKLYDAMEHLELARGELKCAVNAEHDEACDGSADRRNAADLAAYHSRVL